MSEQPWDTTPWDEDTPGVSDGDGVGVSEALIGELIPAATVVANLAEPLTMEEARELTEHIRSTADVLYVLLARAHAGRAWDALGYGSFAAYVREEFAISRSRAYQILDQAKVIQAIEDAAPEGTELTISEAAARDLKAVIGDVASDVADHTRDLPPSEAAQVVDEIIDDYREQRRERRERQEQDALEAGERRADHSGGPYAPPPPPADDFGDGDELGAALIRRNVQAAYDLYSSLSALGGMPDTQDVVDTIPVERRVQINSSLSKALGWLTQFQTAWRGQPWQAGDGEPDDDGGLD